MTTISAAENRGNAPPSVMRRRLEARVAQSPMDAGAWRLLGRYYLKHQQEQEAFNALQRAVELDPDHLAANFDYGQVLLVAGRTDQAAFYLQHVIELAPESDFAQQARDLIEKSSGALTDSEVLQAGFEVKRFDGSDRLDENLQELFEEPPQPSPWDFRLEAGLMYNSNVALSPISRSLAPGTRESFQAFVAPIAEYDLYRGEQWTAGPTFAGYFNLNEGNFREFNLQNYQPGLFLERELEYDGFTLEPRFQYQFTHDEFDGTTFGNRHALTSSASAYWDEGGVTFIYGSFDITDFADDGVFPEFDSRDGWTLSWGVNHTWETESPLVDFFQIGVDMDWTDTTGADFRYRGVYLYAETETELRSDLWLTLTGGWGYRDYFDFTLSPSRDEKIWRGGAELSQKITEIWTLALVFNYDLFDTPNKAFAADRYIGGVMARFRY